MNLKEMKEKLATLFPVNPFSDEYVTQELAFYGTDFPDSIKITDHIKFDLCIPQGRLDDYLNKNMRFMDEKVPRLTIDGRTWMSLTPMELQSAAWALHRSHGVVLTAGLGLGYFALRAAAKPSVSKVIVYEREPAIARWFDETFEMRPEFSKIEVRLGDAREKIKGIDADFVFMDLYETILPDEVVDDAKLFRKRNKFGQYVCWGWELAVLSIVLAGRLQSYMLPSDLLQYFRIWQSTPVLPDRPEYTMGGMFRGCPDLRFCRKVYNSMSVSYS